VRTFVKPLLWLAFAFFLLGSAWGFWSDGQRKLALAQSPPVRVLCADNWIPDSVLKEYSARRNVSIQQWTYSNPSEFLRQMANADGKVDVICTSSLLLRSLINSRWVKKMPFGDLENAKYISVDFLHLPYDPASEYSLPAFWNLYGFFGKGEAQTASAKQTLQSKKVTLWGDELNVLNLLARSGVKIEERLQDSETKSLETEVRKFLHGAAGIYHPTAAAISGEAVTRGVDWILLPLSQVSRLIGDSSPYRFWLPSDGGTVDVGLFAIGERSEHAEIAMDLINFLTSSEQALEMHKRMGAGVVHTSLNHLESIAPLQKAEALRRFPLTRYIFPEVNVEAIPRFQKFFNETNSKSNRDE
jgi:spermidine/putrescine transport system substrate-binding protein